MQRNPRTLLPSAKPYRVKAPNYSSAYYNQGAKSLPSLSAHNTVRIQNGTSWATKGKVIEPLEYPTQSYTIETKSGHRLRRKRRDLLSTKEEFTPSLDIGIIRRTRSTLHWPALHLRWGVTANTRSNIHTIRSSRSVFLCILQISVTFVYSICIYIIFLLDGRHIEWRWKRWRWSFEALLQQLLFAGIL